MGGQLGIFMIRFIREFRFEVDRLLPNSRLQALKELLQKAEKPKIGQWNVKVIDSDHFDLIPSSLARRRNGR